MNAPVAAAPLQAFKGDMKDFNYHFKKEKIKDSEGNVVGEGKKLPSVKLSASVPNAEGIIEIVSAGEKPLALLISILEDAIQAQGRNLLNEIRARNAQNKEPDKEIKAEEVDVSKMLFSFIATIPAAERRGLGISDEDWEDFGKDYREVMVKVTGKEPDRIEKHIKIFQKKFAPCRNDKKALGILKDMLTLWAASTQGMEDNKDVYEYLDKRVDTLLAEEEKVLAEAL